MMTTRHSLPLAGILDAYAGGATIREIAAVHKVSDNTIRRLLHDHGVAVRRRGKRRMLHRRAARIAEMRARGLSWAEIGAELGMTRQGAHDLYKRYTI